MVGSERLSNRLLNIYLPMVFYLVFLLFPFYWMTLVSFKHTNDIFDMKFNPFWIQKFTLENYIYLSGDRVLRVGEEHAHRVGVSTVLSLACSVFAGYALARLRFPGSNFLGVGIFMAYLVPPTLCSCRWRRSSPSSALQHLLGADPHVSHAAHPVRLLAPDGVLPHIPRRSRRAPWPTAARASRSCGDGSPLSVPGLLSAGIFCFTLCWNEFLYA